MIFFISRLFYLVFLISCLSCAGPTSRLDRAINNIDTNVNTQFIKTIKRSSCLSEYPLFMGASITSELGKTPAYQQALWVGNKIENIFNKKNRKKKVSFKNKDYGKNPSMMFLNQLRSKFIKSYSTAIPVTLKKEHTGSGQIKKLTLKKYPDLNNITSIFAIDLFYWDAVFNLCQDPSYNSLNSIDEIISFAKNRNAPLFLGTVPNENPDLVHIDLITSPWKTPNISCLTKINMKLKKKCTVNKNCYLVDFHAMNEDVKSGLKLQHSSGWEVDYYGMRPDGIHISSKGSEILLEKLKQKYVQNPYICKQKKVNKI